MSFSRTIKTKERAGEFLSNLGDIRRDIFTEGFNLPQQLREHFSEDVAIKVTDYLKSNNIDLGDPHQLEKGLENLYSEVRKVPVVRLNLGIHIPERMVDEILLWVQETLGTPALIDYDVNSYLLGGAKITYGGRFGDYTLRKKVDAVNLGSE